MAADSLLPLTEEEIETALAEMCRGAQVLIGGSRSHTTYSYRDGLWYSEDFDEGVTDEQPTTEQVVRYVVRSSPAEVAGLLRRPALRRYSAMLRMGNLAAARTYLHASITRRSSLEEIMQGRMLDAVLAWPAEHPAPEVIEAIRREGLTIYHVFMASLGWERSPEAGRMGLQFMDALMALADETPACWLVRAWFCEMAGDMPSALANLQKEIARTPRSSPLYRGLLEQCQRWQAAIGQL